MFAVLLDFNGTMFFDSSLHMEAWSKIYQVLHPDDRRLPDTDLFCGPRNEVILQSIAPWLSAEENAQFSEQKEALYRLACKDNPEEVRLVSGTENLLDRLKESGIPFAIASASIKPNIDFFFETFDLGRWFEMDRIVYDDGTYPDKGSMYLEAARRLRVDIRDCIIIEDSPSSIRSARQLHPRLLIALGNTASPDLLLASGADRYIRDFSEFDCAWLEH